MLNGFINKIFFSSLTFLVLAFPIFSFAQADDQIQSISWNLTSGNPFSVSGGGTMTLPGQTWQAVSGTFRWQIEWGYAGDFTQTSSGPQIDGTAVPMGNIPQNASPANLFTSTPSHLAQVPGTNQYTFSLPTIFQNGLWPASNYYFDVVEWDPAVTEGGRKFMETVITTGPLNPGSLNFTINQGSNNAYQINVNVTAPQNLLNGMPVALYILSSPMNGMGIDQNQNNPNVIWSATTNFLQNSLSFDIASGLLEEGSTYYLKMVNDRPGAGGLPLTSEDIEITIPEPQTANPNNQNSPGTGGGQTPGTITSDEDFSSGLVNCDGVDVKCNFQKLLELINRSVNFVIIIIGIPLIALSFMYAGFLLVTSGGNSGKKEQAKSAVAGAVTGLVILLGAWLIVRTVLLVFGYEGPLLGILGAN